jgi:hypothetical protein
LEEFSRLATEAFMVPPKGAQQRLKTWRPISQKTEKKGCRECFEDQ